MTEKGKSNNSRKTLSSKTGEIKNKARKLVKKSGISFRFPGNDQMKLIAKGAVISAAAVALLTLMIAGADLRPSAVISGFRDKYAFLHASGQGFPAEISGTRTIKASPLTKGTALLTDTTFTVYDGKGREVVSDSHSFASPAMEPAGVYSLLFDRMGKDYLIRSVSSVISVGTAEDSIICADVSASGHFVLVTNSETTNAKVIAFSPDGKAVHKWKSVEYKISDVAICPSGKYIALSGFSVRNGELISTLIVQKVGAKENLKEFTFEDTLIIDVEFDGNSRVVVIGDDMAATLDVKYESNTGYSYDDRTLNSYDIAANGDIALVFSNNSDGRNASVVVLDDHCREIASINTELTSPYVDIDRGRINLLCQSAVSSYNYKGSLLKQAEVPADCQEIFSSQGRLLAKGFMYLTEVE